MLAAYTGHEALTFPDYLDLETGRTLHAEPGGTYDVVPASGRLVPDLPAGWFTPILMPRVGAWIGVSREMADEGTPAAGDADSGTSTEVQVEPVETGEETGAGGQPGEDDHSAF